MTKYSGKIEAKEQKVSKTNTQYVLFTIGEKKWNCFDAIVNQKFQIGDFVEFQTLISASKDPNGKHYENLLPETMKIINRQTPEIEHKEDVPNRAIQGNACDDSVPFQSILKDGWKNETVCKNINENPDSLEIGTPSKGGAIKVYHNYDDPEGFLVKILNAKSVRDEANRLFNPEQ